MQAPWTEVGRLESDVRDIKGKLDQIPKSYEVDQISRNVDGLERSIREVSSTCDGLRHELETLREEMRQLREEVFQSDGRNHNANT